MLRICKGGKRTMKKLGISVHARYLGLYRKPT